MHDIDLLMRIAFFCLQYPLADIVCPELIDGGARKHSEFTVNRVDFSVGIFRQVDLGNVSCAESEIVFLVRFDHHGAGAEHDTVVVQLLYLLLKIRPMKSRVHGVLGRQQPLARLIIFLQVSVTVAKTKPRSRHIR